MQLFIDAGIPLNQDIVIDVIRHVIIERLKVLFGYPQPVNDSLTKTTAQVTKYNLSMIVPQKLQHR